MKYDFRILKLIFLLPVFVSGMSILAQVENGPDTIVGPEFYVIRNINFVGNKVTKDRIIERELVFHENDTIIAADLIPKKDQSRQNLMNTSLFNFVTVDTVPVPHSSTLLDIRIEFIERWYIWPVPIIELADRNLNEWLQKMDWKRINYGMFLTWNNFRGRRESLVLYARFGYDEKYNFSYKIPYINKKQTLGIGFSGGLSQNHEIAYNSVDNKEVYYRSETGRPKKEYFGYGEMFFRKSIHNQHWLVGGYSDLQVADSVLYYNPDYSYGGLQRNRSFNLYYQFKTDHRNFKQYPLLGYYFDFDIDKRGLGIYKNPTVNGLAIKANFRKYYQIKGRFYWASGLTVKYSPIEDQPYVYTKGLGYGREFVRGYEYYVVDGQHYGLLKNNLKFELVPMRVQEFKFIPTDKFNKLYYAFYLNVFVDLGYVHDYRDYVNNPLANEILPGYGVGIDFVTYYDFVFRFEYSFNKRGESGFFIHLLPSI